MKRSITLIMLTFCLLCSIMGSGQTDSLFYSIETIDGNTFIGQIISEDASSILFKTKSLGEIKILKTNIKTKTPIREEQIVDGQYWFDNPQATRYFWQPNGYGLKEGEGYYQNIWLLFNQFSIGASDHITIGGGFVPTFLFGGGSTPVWFTPKVSVPIVKDQFNLGAGVLAGTVLIEDDTGFGIAYGVATYGTRDSNISFGMGYGFSGGGWADLPTFTLSAINRVGKKGYIITENYFIGTGGENNVTLISIGGRSLVKKVGIDYGLFIPIIGDAHLIALPLLGLTVPFGQAMISLPKN